jgi:hypothetical protein
MSAAPSDEIEIGDALGAVGLRQHPGPIDFPL